MDSADEKPNDVSHPRPEAGGWLQSLLLAALILLCAAVLKVVTLKGDVRLTGTLDRQAQFDEAIKIARSSEGAHSIHDELALKK